MKIYSHFQFAWVIVVGFIVIFLLAFFFLRNRDENFSNLVGTGIVLLLVVVLFFGMNVKVTDKKMTIIYGIGIVRKNINLQDVASCNVATYGWLSGFGIRFLRNGVLYNVSGTKAVKLKMKDKNRFIMVGTDEPELLKKAIDNAISSKVN